MHRMENWFQSVSYQRYFYDLDRTTSRVSSISYALSLNVGRCTAMRAVLRLSDVHEVGARNTAVCGINVACKHS